MHNVELHIKGNTLIIRIDLTAEGQLSRSLKSLVIASTGGNQPLIDARGYRAERVNLTVSKPLPKEDL